MKIAQKLSQCDKMTVLDSKVSTIKQTAHLKNNFLRWNISAVAVPGCSERECQVSSENRRIAVATGDYDGGGFLE